MAYDTSGNISAQNSVPAGVASNNSAVVAALNNADYNTLAIQTVGTYTGALSLQVSINGKNWITLGGNVFLNVNTGAWSATIPSAAQAVYQADVTGYGFVRLTALAAFTGSVDVSLSASEGAGLVKLATALPSGTTVIAQQTATATNAATTTSVNSAASTNAANVKTSAGTLYAMVAHNTTAADKFIRFYNKASAPTVGTDTPVVIIRVPANSSKEVSFGTVGFRFATGIGHAITNAAAVLDATAVAAGDVQLAYEWA